MKKRSIRTGILFALLTPVLLICAENPIYAATTQTAGSATVSYHVDPAYQVTIPVDTSMRFNETETSYGNIVVEQAQIEDGKCIQVSLLSNLNLKNSNNSKAVIPYQILAQDEVGSRQHSRWGHSKKTHRASKMDLSVVDHDRLSCDVSAHQHRRMSKRQE